MIESLVRKQQNQDFQKSEIFFTETFEPFYPPERELCHENHSLASIALADMGTGAVDSGVILDGEVSLDDMNSNAVNSAVIVDGTVALQTKLS